MATTLKITNSDVFSLTYPWPDGADTEFLGLYGDNGGDPDGNAWLPSETVDPRSFEARYLIDQGDAVATEVMYANDAGILNYLHIPAIEGTWEDETIESVQAQMNDDTYGWAHYGSYGTGDGSWVFEAMDGR